MKDEPQGMPLNFSHTKPKAPFPDVSLEMLLTKEGNPRALLANAITALRYDPEWSGVLAFNEFSLYTTIKKSPPWPKQAGSNWTDYDDSRCANWLQHQKVLVNSKVAGEAAQTVARDNSFHPVKDYLNGLKWDQTQRLDNWLSGYLGVEPSPFVAAVGARWMISAIARIFRPGCQVDHTMLLEGPQGIRKSTALRVLASDEWFADHISELGSKDSRIELHGKWILEMSEMDRVRRGELERVKAFLTARSDHFRVPYGRRAEDVPRTCVFAASVNDETPLTDETGNRRFWPVRCGAIAIGALQRDRDQLWAEAFARFRDGACWWLDSEELNGWAKREQEERFDLDVWHDTVMGWANDPKQRYEPDTGAPLEPFDSVSGCVNVTEVLLHAIGKSLEHSTPTDKNRVARCLIHEGWKRKQSGTKDLRGKRFYMRGER